VLAAAEGPFVSVFFDVEQAAVLRWTALRDQLEARGASPGALSAVDRRLAERSSPPDVQGRALIVARDRVLLDHDLPVRPRTTISRFSPSPYLLPLAELAEPLLPHLVVRLGDDGADLRGVDRSGRPVAIGTVGPLASGRASLTDLAEEVVALVERVDARVVVLSGSSAARSELRTGLPPDCRGLCVGVEWHDGFPLLASGVSGDAELEVVRRFRDGTAPVAHGLADVAAALASGRVEALLLTGPLVGDRLVPGTSERADEALPRAAALCGAQIVLTGGRVELREDAGALLRP
jgi:hypothetical protein